MNRIFLFLFCIQGFIKIALTQDTTFFYDDSKKVMDIRYVDYQNKLSIKIDTAIYYTDSLNYAIVKKYETFNKEKRVLSSKYYEFTVSHKCMHGKVVDTFFNYKFDDLSNIIIELTIDEGVYINGKANGHFFSILNQDTIIKGRYRNGLLHGDYFDKLLSLNCNYDDDTSYNGQHVDSKIYVYGKYKNGVRVGEWKYYYNEILIAKGEYANEGSYLGIDIVNEKIYKVQKKDTLVLYNDFSLDKINYYEENIFGMRIIPVGAYLRKGRWDFFSLDGNLVKSLYYNKNGIIKGTEVKKEITLEYFFCI